MPINDNDPVCGHGNQECTCLDDLEFTPVPQGADLGNLRFLNVHVSTGQSASGATPGGTPYELGSYGVGIGTGAPINPPSGCFPSQVNPGFQFPTVTEKCPGGHIVGDEIREDRDGTITGTCVQCDATVFLPRIPGGVCFERAGNLVGRAMTLDAEDDEETVGELIADLNLLERDVKREIARYKRALKMAAIARSLVKRRALDGAASVVS